MLPSCNGKGAPCPCLKFKKGKHGKRCQDCGHSKHRHTTNGDATRSKSPSLPFPPPLPSQPCDTIGSIVARQMQHHTRMSTLGNLKPLVSHESAIKKVLPGYHGRRATASSKSAEIAQGSCKASSSSTKKKKLATKSIKFQQIGSLLFLLCGMWACTDKYDKEKVELRSDKPLTGPEEEELCEGEIGLLVDQEGDGLPLQFSLDWSTQAIDKWLCGLATKLFYKELVSGADLGKCIGGQARKKETFRLHIATHHPIDKSIWANFDRAIRIAQKKPMNVDFVDSIERKPATEGDSSDEYSSSGEGSEFNIDTAMEEAMQSDSSDEELFGGLTKPATSTANNQEAKHEPLFNDGSNGEEQAAKGMGEEELNANGKRLRAMSPPAYHTHLAKWAKRALLHNKEEASGSIPTTSLKVLFIDGVDFNIPDSPDAFSYYYSPGHSPPFISEAEASSSTSHIECSSSHVIHNSPGRPSKTAWKKCNAST
ncbi:hypothetical protein V8D89_002577 [Ganoderma adspersum]